MTEETAPLLPADRPRYLMGVGTPDDKLNASPHVVTPVVRLDTGNASYVANHEAVYSVETDARGRDRIVPPTK